MRGLPPIPADVLELRWVWLVRGNFVSSTTRYFCPGSGAFTFDELVEIHAALAFFWLDFSTQLTTEHAQLATSRLTTHGVTPLRNTSTFAPNHGEWPGGTPLNTALVMYHQTARGGRRGHGVVYFPTFPPDFTDDDRNINSNGFLTAVTAGRNFAANVQGVPTPNDQPILPVVVERSRGGVPLTHAEVSLVDVIVPSTKIGTLRRRVRGSGRISPD